MEFFDKVRKIGLLQAIDDVTGNFFSYMRYRKCKIQKKPYFGSYLAATQGNSRRHFYMQELVGFYCSECDENISILEIGSWAGGSAITWANAIKKYGKKGGTVYCIDPWQCYIEDQKEVGSWVHQTMIKGLRNQKIVNLFNHNIAASGLEGMVCPLRGTSEILMPLFKANQFDMIFVDGNHLFEPAYRDLVNASCLVKDGGILCGDDLELQSRDFSTIDLDSIVNVDVMSDPVSGRRFHPGVTRAVWKFFRQDVSCWEGFWAMRKQGDNWERLPLETFDGTRLRIPDHLA